MPTTTSATADGQPEYVEQRVQYSYGQLLQAEDFTLDQQYQIDRLRRVTSGFLSPGIISGLEVTTAGDEVRISQGSALDALGRLIVWGPEVSAAGPLKALKDGALVDLTKSALEGSVLSIGYAVESGRHLSDAIPADPPGGTSATTIEIETRWREAPALYLDPPTAAELKSGERIILTGASRVMAGVRPPASAPDAQRSALCAAGDALVVTGPLRVTGLLTGGDLAGQGTLSVGGALRVGTGLTVGSVNLATGESLAVKGAARIDGGLSIGGELRAGIGLTVGSVNLATGESLAAKGAARIDGGLTVTGATTLSNGLAITGAATVSGTLKLQQGVAISEFASALGNTEQSVPTALAVKTYVDSQISQVNQVLTTKASVGGATAQDFQAKQLTISGRMGIKAASPAAPLHIIAERTSSDVVRLQTLGTPAYSGLPALPPCSAGLTLAGLAQAQLGIKVSGPPSTLNDNGVVPDVTVMTLLGSGNVGIGTTEPSERLVLQSNSTSEDVGLLFRAKDHAGQDPADTQPQFYDAIMLRAGWHDTTSTAWGEQRLSIRGQAKNPTTNANYWNEIMTLKANGYVGIGTNEPRAQLVTGDRFGAAVSGGPAGGGIFGSNLATSNGTALYTPYTHGNGYGYAGVHATWGKLQFFTGGGNTSEGAAINPAPRMVIDSSGKVNIGGLLEVTGRLLVKGRPLLNIQSGEKYLENVSAMTLKDYPITFSQSFNSPPQVYVALARIDANHMFNARCNVFAQSITANGFTLTIETWADTQMYSIRAVWIAYGEAA